MSASADAAAGTRASQHGGFVLAGSKRKVEVGDLGQRAAARVRADLHADSGGLPRAGGRGLPRPEDAGSGQGEGCQSLDHSGHRRPCGVLGSGLDYDGNPVRTSVRPSSSSSSSSSKKPMRDAASPLHAYGRSATGSALPGLPSGLPGIAGCGHTPAHSQQVSGSGAPSPAMRTGFGGLASLSGLGTALTPALKERDARRQPVPSSPFPSTPCPSDTSLGTPITHHRSTLKQNVSGHSFIHPATQTQVADPSFSATFSSPLLSQTGAPQPQQQPKKPPPPLPSLQPQPPQPPQQQPQTQQRAQLQAQKQPDRKVQLMGFVPPSPPPGTPPPEMEAELLQEAESALAQFHAQHCQEEHAAPYPGSPPQGGGPQPALDHVGAQARAGGIGTKAPESTDVKGSSGWHLGGGVCTVGNGGERREYHNNRSSSGSGCGSGQHGYIQKSMPTFSLFGGRRSESHGAGSSRPSTGAHNESSENLWPRLNLPQEVIKIFQHRGIQQPFDWQVECLDSQPLRNDQNFIYALPTSAGKTFVSEVMILRKMLKYKRTRRRLWDTSVVPCKCMIVFPYVSLCEEKRGDFVEFGDAVGFSVEYYYDHMGKFPLVPRAQQLYIATIEKAERIMTTLLEEGRAGELGLVVVDELHFLGENNRGCILETLLTRLKTFVPTCQIVGMSATLPNLRDVELWLNAQKFDGSGLDRPVELLEHVVFPPGQQIKHKKGNCIEKFERPGDALTALVKEGIAGEHNEGKGSVLVFCATVKETEIVAAKLLHSLDHDQQMGRIANKDTLSMMRSDLVQHLRSIKGDVGPPDLLQKLVEKGIAFHNAKLLREERKLIEDAFKGGVLQVITCTSTLAAGVNLPAGTVVISKPKVGIDSLKPSTYKQMAGRAGRTGLDSGYTSGRSFLIATNDREHKLAQELMAHGPQEVRSQLMAPSGWGDKNSQPSPPLKKAQEGNPHAAQGAHSSTGQRRAKEHPDEFMRAVLGFVCAGRLPQDAANVVSGGPSHVQAASAPLGCDGVEVSAVQGYMRGTFFGVVWTRLERETQKTPDVSTMHLPANALAAPRGSNAKEPVDTLDDIVEEVLLWLAEQKLIVTRGHTDFSLAACVDAEAPPGAGGSGSAAHSSEGTKIGGNRLHPTLLGRATYLSCLPIKVAIEVYSDMSNGREAGVVLGDLLHLLFMLTPVDQFAQRFLEDEAFWLVLARKWEKDFDETRQRVVERIGLDFAWLQCRCQPTVKGRNASYREKDRKVCLSCAHYGCRVSACYCCLVSTILLPSVIGSILSGLGVLQTWRQSHPVCRFVCVPRS